MDSQTRSSVDVQPGAGDGRAVRHDRRVAPVGAVERGLDDVAGAVRGLPVEAYAADVDGLAEVDGEPTVRATAFLTGDRPAGGGVAVGRAPCGVGEVGGRGRGGPAGGEVDPARRRARRRRTASSRTG